MNIWNTLTLFSPILHITSPAVLIKSHSGWVFPSSASPKMITFIRAFILPEINCIIHIVITFKLDYPSIYCMVQNNRNGNRWKVVNCLLVAVPSRKYSVLVFNIYWFSCKWLQSLYLKFPSVSHPSILWPQCQVGKNWKLHISGDMKLIISQKRCWWRTIQLLKISKTPERLLGQAGKKSMLDKIAKNHRNPILTQIH